MPGVPESVRRLAGVAVAVLGMVPAARPAVADYLIHSGDTLEISVIGAPELRQRAVVNVDGAASFPLIGEIRAAGLSLSAIRSKVRQTLPDKEFRRLANDGREYPVILPAQGIDVTIAEYRPIYLNGDVSKPGELVYRPGLTVRQAIALAGGYDIMRLRMNNPFLEQADLRGEYESQWTEFAKAQVRVARLQAELADKTELDRKSMIEVPLARAAAERIAKNENALLELHRADYANEKQYLRQSIQQQVDRATALKNLHSREEDGTRIDREDLDRLEGALQKGAVPVTRLVEGKRMLLYSSTRALQTLVQLAQAERDRADAARRLEKLDTDLRAQRLADLQEAEVRLAEIRTRLQALSEKLVYTGMVRSQLVSGSRGKPALTIIRNGENGAETSKADEDTPLQPGDVVEVALTAELVPGAPVRSAY